MMFTENVISSKAKCSALSLLLVTVFPLVSWADTGMKDQERTIRQLYADFGYTWCNERKMSKFFTEKLAKDTAKACDSDLIGMEIGCPIIPGNDYVEKEIMGTLEVNCKQQVTPRCTAVFDSFGKSYTVEYRLQQQSGKWAIKDIIDEQGSFRNNLSKALK